MEFVVCCLQAEVRKQTDKRLYIARFPRPEDTQLPQQQVLEQRVKDLSDEVSAMNRKVDKLKVIRASCSVWEYFFFMCLHEVIMPGECYGVHQVMKEEELCILWAHDRP